MVRMMVQMAGLIFMVPAIWVNVEIGASSGRSDALVFASIGFVLAAGISGIILEKALRDKALFMALTAAFCLAAFTALNVANAVGLASHERSDKRGEAGAAIAKVQRLDHEFRTLDLAIKVRNEKVQNQSSAMVQAAVEAKKILPFYKRSESCANVTLTDTRKECGELFELEALLSVAKDQERDTARRGVVAEELNNLKAVPESVDPQAASIVSVLSILAPLGADAEKSTGLLLNVWFGICVELMASLMPALIAFGVRPPLPKMREGQNEVSPKMGEGGEGAALGEKSENPPLPEKPDAVKPVAKQATSGKARRGRSPKTGRRKIARSKTTPVVELPASVPGFIEARLMQRGASVLAASSILTAYCEYCEEIGVKPSSQRALGMGLTAAGFAKSKDGVVVYHGVAFRGSKPDLVAVG